MKGFVKDGIQDDEAGRVRPYEVTYCSGSGEVLMQEQRMFPGDTEALLRLLCENAMERYQRMQRRLRKSVPEVKEHHYRYEVEDFWGQLMDCDDGDRIVEIVHVRLKL